MTQKPLEIGVLLDDCIVDEWLWLSLARVKASSAVSRVVILVDKAFRKEEPLPAAYRFFESVDAFLSRHLIRHDAFVPRDVRELFPDAHQVEINLDAIASLHLDILVNASARPLPEAMRAVVQHGIWRHQFGDRQQVLGGPVGLQEYIRSMPTTAASLEMVSARGEFVLERLASTTYLFSPKVNRHLLCRSCIVLLSRHIEKFFRLGPERFYTEVESRHSPFEFYSHPEYGAPIGWGMMRLWMVYASRIVAKAWRDKLTWEKWHLLINRNPDNATRIARYQQIVSPDDEYWADPFIGYHDDQPYIFMEVFCRKRQKGHLAVSMLKDDNTLTAPVTILDASYHLSYPCLVEYDGVLYMIPESKDNHAVSLYRCVEFPHRWEFVMHLMENIDAVDTTPFFHEGRWWLFMTVVEVEGARARENLFLFHAETLLTRDWVAHPLNPVVTDTRYARPAGHLLRVGHRIFRPAQDCGYIYGHAVRFREIKTLNEHAYEEVEGTTINPSWSTGLLGVHTFARHNGLTVMDAYRRVYRHRLLRWITRR